MILAPAPLSAAGPGLALLSILRVPCLERNLRKYIWRLTGLCSPVKVSLTREWLAPRTKLFIGYCYRTSSASEDDVPVPISTFFWRRKKSQFHTEERPSLRLFHSFGACFVFWWPWQLRGYEQGLPSRPAHCAQDPPQGGWPLEALPRTVGLLFPCRCKCIYKPIGHTRRTFQFLE